MPAKFLDISLIFISNLLNKYLSFELRAEKSIYHKKHFLFYFFNLDQCNSAIKIIRKIICTHLTKRANCLALNDSFFIFFLKEHRDHFRVNDFQKNKEC